MNIKKVSRFLMAAFSFILTITLIVPTGTVQASANKAPLNFAGPIVTGLPFAVGETWNFTQNFHGSNALDFQTRTGRPGRVTAADSGVVTMAYQTCIKVQRSDGLILGYQHIEPADISTHHTGDTIQKGDFIGMTTGKWTDSANGCGGTSDGNVVHFWAEGPNFQVGSILGGYTIDGICQTQPALYKNGQKVCPINPVTYEEASYIPFGSNASSRLFFDQGDQRANLEVCADNLAGNTVYVKFWRTDKSWDYSQTAQGNCLTFWDVDGAGGVLTDRPYYANVSMGNWPATTWVAPCLEDSGRVGMCTQAQYPNESKDPIVVLPTCPATITGWKGEYYNTNNLSGPLTFCRDEAEVNFNWDMGSPDAAVSADSFSAKYTRTQDFAAGSYTFRTTFDDGARVIVDGQTLIDQWVSPQPGEQTAKLDLTAGSHTVQVDYYENSGSAALKVWWAKDTDPVVPSVTTVVDPKSINVNGTSTAVVSLVNTPSDVYTAAEFTCTYDPALVEAGSIIANTDLFGADAVTAINGPQNGKFIVAIAGSNGKKAMGGGAAFTFNLKGLAVGDAVIECKARVSKGNNALADISYVGDTLHIGTPPPDKGTLAGQVLACKPVTIHFNGIDTPVNPDGAFSIDAPVGVYTVNASASGFLSAATRDPEPSNITIAAGATTNMSKISLIAGDIDGNNVIDQFDALTIGMSYNTNVPPAADLNCDSVVNVLDLELLAGHYRAVGPIDWQ